MHARFGCSFVSWAFESETWFLVSNCSCLILAVFTKADHCSSGCSLQPDQCSWHCYWHIVNNSESSACPSFHPSCLFLAFFVFLSIDWLFPRVVSIYRYHVHIYKYCLFCGLPECLLSILNYSYHCLSTLQWPIACSVANLTFSKSLNTYQGVIFWRFHLSSVVHGRGFFSSFLVFTSYREELVVQFYWFLLLSEEVW